MARETETMDNRENVESKEETGEKRGTVSGKIYERSRGRL